MDTAKRRAIQFGAEWVDLAEVKFTGDLLRCVPADFARRYQAMPVSDTHQRLAIAIADPSDLETMDALFKALARTIEWQVADKAQLQAFIERLYGSGLPAVEP